MENANNKKGSFMGLLPLVIFLVVYFAMGIGTGDLQRKWLCSAKVAEMTH